MLIELGTQRRDCQERVGGFHQVAGTRAISTVSTVSKPDHLSARDTFLSHMMVRSCTLSRWATWRENQYWVSSDGTVSLAYRLMGRVVIVVTNPLGECDANDLWFVQFMMHCQAQRWIPAFFCMSPEMTGNLLGFGLRSIHIAEEALIRLGTRPMSVKLERKLRHAANRAQREGVSSRMTTWAQLTRAERAGIFDMQESCTSARVLPTLGFTVGTVGEMADPDVSLTVAKASDGTISGVASWSPVYNHGAIVGRTLESLSRRKESFNGTQVFLIGAALHEFSRQKLRLVSLSGVPAIDYSTQNDQAPGRLMRTGLFGIAKFLDAALGSRGLRRFKQKFEPEFRTLSLVYVSRKHMPRLILAIARLYLTK